jgi:DNA processing protein
MEEEVCLLGLSQISGIGPILARNLLEEFGSAQEVFSATEPQLLKISGIGPQLVENLLKGFDSSRLAKKLQFFRSKGIKIIPYTSDLYPQELAQIKDRPIFIYYNGQDDVLNKNPMVAIVGTRNPSRYGKAQCQKIVEELSAYEVTIVSGLAYGIDAIAHQTALSCQLPTIAVLGGGFEHIYPNDHWNLAQKIHQTGGLISEYPPDQKVEKEHFPMRNRIIAGLSSAVLIIETALKGGSIITAGLASGYFKEVFALPGSVQNVKSRGCHSLIKRNIAALFESGHDVAQLMGWEKKKNNLDLKVEISEDEKRILNLLDFTSPKELNSLTQKSSFPGGYLKALLLELELKNLIISLPGNQYILNHK